VLKQALTGGTIGYLLGNGAAAMLVRAAANSTVSLVLLWQMAAATGLITLALCRVASLAAVHRIKSIDPTIVFRCATTIWSLPEMFG
jgi:hypothetical protein